MSKCMEAERSPSQLLVDEALSDDNSVVLLPQKTMEKLHLSHGDPVFIKGKRSRQAVSIAMAYDTCKCDIEPKIRLNRDVMNDLCVRIGDFVSLHCPGDVKREKPMQILTTDDNDLKDTEFLNNLPDDILFEIFLRLPSCRSALQYSSVNKRWSSIISNSSFIRGFIGIQDCKFLPFSDDYYCSRPFTLLFVRYDRYFHEIDEGDNNNPHYFEPFCQLFCEKSKALHGKIPSYYLSFLPCPVVIIASFDDLVVATSLEHTQRDSDPYFGAPVNYICNPLTKQWVLLPEVIPPFQNAGYGFVRESATSSDARYRLVMIGHAHSDSDYNRWDNGDPGAIHRCEDNEFVTKVFRSEIGQWSEFVITYPRPEKYWGVSQNLDKVTVGINGILYWLEGNPLKGVVAFDPFNDIYTGQCRFIPLPARCFKNTEWSTVDKVCLGVVKGQLRLSQLYKANSYYAFRVWELKNYDTEFPSWRLLYNLKLNCSGRRVYVLSFHPNNTNLIFMLCGNDICQYDIFEKKYEKIGEYLDEWPYPARYISTFTLLHPSWPTQIPALSSS